MKRLKWSISGIHNGIWGDEPDGENDIICIRVADFDRIRRSVANEPTTIRSVAMSSREQRVLQEGDLLIEKSGGGDNQLVGCVVHFGHAFEAVCSNFVARIRLQDGMLPQYWSYVHSSLYSARLNFPAIKQTTGIQNLDAEAYFNIKVAFPPIQEQRTIANYLDRETARVDGLIAEKERMLALLEEKRTALISRIVTRGLDSNVPLKPSGQEWLGEIPVHWGLQRLKQLADVRGGLTLGKQYSGELLEYPYLRVANVQDGYLKLDDVSTVEVPVSEAASNLLAYGDVLMNEGGDIDKLGRGCVWRDEIAPCLHQNHVFSVRPHSVDSDWLALWTSTLQAKRYFESRAKRSTNLASISGSNIKEVPVPLPPINEQLAIQKFLADRHSRLEIVRGELRDSLRLLSERRAALITAAVTGQIPL
ncbi:type I restriction enzyme S subunit [Comamonas odontotermitis]|uniref:Type I restriction enzyme S subunit n=1 Tax=Comamonas odontotermitis TaxID=379895 RepID=A0ABR6RID5_9BURK|nr:restriction endonuclease subunit S [Comamonas odontotermitis]MBB6578930.1 type I restriction enzyme S subunit [Comamonas odontotermitis]